MCFHIYMYPCNITHIISILLYTRKYTNICQRYLLLLSVSGKSSDKEKKTPHVLERWVGNIVYVANVTDVLRYANEWCRRNTRNTFFKQSFNFLISLALDFVNIIY